MLSPELVRARTQNGKLCLKPLAGARERERGLELATALIQTARDLVGRTRQELEQAFSELPAEPRERLLFEGLKKLTFDLCTFQGGDALDAPALRRELFLQATQLRKNGSTDLKRDRDELLAAAAAARSLSVEHLAVALFSDLRGADVLLAPAAIEPVQLLARWELAQAQAVLLRAVSVVAEVGCSSPAGYRALFHKLKFRRLLYRIDHAESGRYVLRIDGPFSLFDSVTKYGLQLALVLPTLLECDWLRLEADVRWGARRQKAVFRLEGSGTGGLERDQDAKPSAEVQALLDGCAELGGDWAAAPATEILDIAGEGVCVPDVVFEHRRSRQRVFLEVLGFWSRDAVWRRVELVKAGLATPVLFAVSSRLRVSEAVLDESESGALYVYRATMSPRAILRRVEALGQRPAKRKRRRDTAP